MPNVADSSRSMLEEVLTPSEAAKDLRVSKAHLYKILKGQVAGCTVLPHLTCGRTIRILRSSFEGWKRENESARILADSNFAADGILPSVGNECRDA